MESVLKIVSSGMLTPVEKRLFAEYGAVFATTATPPPTVVFAGADDVEAFQASLAVASAAFGVHSVVLQTAALEALSSAASEAAENGASLTARAADAGGRSYEETVKLWTRNVTRGIEHWQELGRMDPEHGRSLFEMSPKEQVAVVLDLEEREGIFFGTFFDKSILYSVAAPGASQHLSMLAFDVAEYEDRETERILGRYGWYRTVPNDLPHFTYLGRAEDELPAIGLRRVERMYREQMYGFWTPDPDRL